MSAQSSSCKSAISAFNCFFAETEISDHLVISMRYIDEYLPNPLVRTSSPLSRVYLSNSKSESLTWTDLVLVK
ncbi:hypothetical protein SBDP1_430007 [Syntrophobacter sp. SbD1]|nr:hypothetical protein SBDP1_430007 [Syntrophobacter sp. SbD1]